MDKQNCLKNLKIPFSVFFVDGKLPDGLLELCKFELVLLKKIKEREGRGRENGKKNVQCERKKILYGGSSKSMSIFSNSVNCLMIVFSRGFVISFEQLRFIGFACV